MRGDGLYATVIQRRALPLPTPPWPCHSLRRFRSSAGTEGNERADGEYGDGARVAAFARQCRDQQCRERKEQNADGLGRGLAGQRPAHCREYLECLREPAVGDGGRCGEGMCFSVDPSERKVRGNRIADVRRYYRDNSRQSSESDNEYDGDRYGGPAQVRVVLPSVPHRAQRIEEPPPVPWQQKQRNYQQNETHAGVQHGGTSDREQHEG